MHPDVCLFGRFIVVQSIVDEKRPYRFDFLVKILRRFRPTKSFDLIKILELGLYEQCNICHTIVFQVSDGRIDTCNFGSVVVLSDDIIKQTIAPLATFCGLAGDALKTISIACFLSFIRFVARISAFTCC